ncbi:Na/Pi symporter [Bacillus sp. 2205SS5-2]|uniref:Na/Pi symporter n=1 Tax=Bacillus sp. 2205SS5-2 TaxID=3109031 RepID=UPI0030073AA6
MLLFVFFVLLVGSFLTGILILRQGLYTLSGESLKTWLQTYTKTPTRGLIAGTICTGILQSSSVVTVMTIGFVSAGILTFQQSIGIILGTNIGTTVTLELFSISISQLIIPLLLLGLLLSIFQKVFLKSLGFIFIGLSIVLLSMNGLELFSDSLQKNLDFSSNFRSPVISLLFGIVFAACVQSSTATTAFAMSLVSSQLIGIEGGILIMFGANIGTCITALFASIGGGKEARLTAWVHVWLNVIGVGACLPLVRLLGDLAQLLSSDPAVQLAHASVIFNVGTSLLVLPFTSQFERFVLFVHDR